MESRGIKLAGKQSTELLKQMLIGASSPGMLFVTEYLL
jgi:hypothetical protein